MCGIAGILERGGKADRAVVERMLDRLVHRGPDDRGVWADGGVVLGQTRLSILDLSSLGHQPMCTPDGLGVITYNGEVYNFKELRLELEAEGIVFRSRCDTEVVLHALHRWGPERAIPKLDGMFGLAYYDARDATLWLARDRIGIKPLYVARTARGVAFASEIKALLAHPDVACRPHMQAVVTQIIEERIDGKATLFEGIEAIEPGMLLRFAGGNGASEQSIKYFDVLRDVDPLRILEAGKLDFAEHAKRFERLLDRSVEMHLASDAPLAVMCSGGLDSGLVTAFSKQHKPDIVAYVADISNMHGEEVRRARLVTGHLGVELRPVPVDESVYYRLWPRAIYANDQPLYFAQQVAAMAVAEQMRADGFKVVLTGDGADELFGGYPWHVASYKLWRKRRLRAEWLARTPFLNRLRRLHRWFAPIDLDVLARRPLAHTSQRQQAALAARQTVALVSRRELRHAALFERLSPLPRHEDRAFLMHTFEDIYLHLAESLRSEDRMAMAFSIEARIPFLENQLIDFALHLPVSAKYRAGRTKMLVYGLGERRLPRDVMNLEKIGFWVRDSMWRGVEPVLRRGAVAELLEWDDADQESLLEVLRRHPRFLFRVVCFELWARLFFRREAPEQLTETLLRHRDA